MILAALCLTASLEAQTFSWGEKQPARNETESEVTHVLDNKLYRVVSRYNENLFNRDVTIDSYIPGGFKNDEKFDVSVEQPVMGKAMLTHLAMFPDNGVNYLSFLDEYDNKSKDRVLFGQKINIGTGQKFEQFRITGMPGRNSEYIIAQSAGRQYYAVIKRFTADKKENEKINVAVLDKSGKVVNEISYQTPYLNKAKADEFGVTVSDDGRVCIVRNIDLAKQKPFRSLFYWDGKSNTMAETSLKLENDHQIYFTKGRFEGGNFQLLGLCTRVGAKAVQVHRGNNPASAVYMARFDANGNKLHTEISPFPETGLRIKDILHENGKTWIVADRMIENKKAQPMKGNAFELQYDYSYENLGIAFAKIDDATGKLDWFKDVPYSEIGTQGDNGKYLSYLHFLRNGEMSILYNDRQKFEIKDRENKTRSTFDRFIIMETYDADGKQKSQRTISNTGLEPQWDHGNRQWLEDFDLDTSVLVKVSENKYIVRSSSRHNERYGYLAF